MPLTVCTCFLHARGGGALLWLPNCALHLRKTCLAFRYHFLVKGLPLMHVLGLVVLMLFSLKDFFGDYTDVR